MSAPLAGKFQDHYAALGIEPKSDSETIQKAYTKLAQRYHPNTTGTADPERFAAVNHAYEVLSDPAARREFDKLKGIGQEEGTPKFSGLEFFETLGRESVLRSVLLCVLYDRRLAKPFTPSLSMRHVENIIDATTEELSSALWYLKQRGLVCSDDKSSLQITVDGMDFLESHKPAPEAVMPFIKMAADSKAHEESSPKRAPGGEGDSIRNALQRALAR